MVEPRASAELRRGFDILDLDNGIGWELVTSMVRYKARQRTSAKAALAHPYFIREGLLGLSVMQNLRLQLFRATQKDYSEAARWIIGLMARSGTESVGGFTEAQLQELRVSVAASPLFFFSALLSRCSRLLRKTFDFVFENADQCQRESPSPLPTCICQESTFHSHRLLLFPFCAENKTQEKQCPAERVSVVAARAEKDRADNQREHG